MGGSSDNGRLSGSKNSGGVCLNVRDCPVLTQADECTFGCVFGPFTIY